MLSEAGRRRHLVLLFVVALGLRLLVAWTLPPTDAYLPQTANTDDAPWYLVNGLGLFSGQEHGTVRGIPFYTSRIPTAPLYLAFVGLFQVMLPDSLALIAIRTVQALLGVAVVFLGARVAVLLTRPLSGDDRAGWIAGWALALHPGLVLESGNIATEGLYLFWLTLGVWLYVERVVVLGGSRPWRMTALVGVILGLATLTRAVLLLFPLGLAMHLWVLRRRAAWGPALALMLAFGLTVGTWTAYNGLMWGRFVIASDQFMPAVWRGSIGEPISPQEMDARLKPDERPEGCEVDCGVQIPTEAYVEEVRATVTADFGGYLRLRLSELSAAYFQPHGTLAFGDETSLRALVLGWLGEDRSLTGLLDLMGSPGFWPKLTLYLFHWVGMLLGVLGMGFTRANWRVSLVLIGFIAYTTLIHVVMLALPRYIFPTTWFFWVLAAGALAHFSRRAPNVNRRAQKNNTP